jgi:hypothetical protein
MQEQSSGAIVPLSKTLHSGDENRVVHPSTPFRFGGY